MGRFPRKSHVSETQKLKLDKKPEENQAASGAPAHLVIPANDQFQVAHKLPESFVLWEQTLCTVWNIFLLLEIQILDFSQNCHQLNDKWRSKNMSAGHVNSAVFKQKKWASALGCFDSLGDLKVGERQWLLAGPGRFHPVGWSWDRKHWHHPHGWMRSPSWMTSSSQVDDIIVVTMGGWPHHHHGRLTSS